MSTDNVRQRTAVGESNPLIIDLGSSGGTGRSASRAKAGRTPQQQSINQTIQALKPLLIVFGTIMLLSLGGIVLFLTDYNSQDDPSYSDNHVGEEMRITQLGNEKKMLQDEVSHLRNELATAKRLQPKQLQQPVPDGKDDKKLNYLTKYKQRMQEQIQMISKRELLQKYGPGPHIVDIYVEFDPQSNIYNAADGDGGVIRIQLAPVEEMPATVYLFLQQVTTGLMNGCSFHRNAGHVVQGGPASNFLQPQAKHKDFKMAQLESVPFQE